MLCFSQAVRRPLVWLAAAALAGAFFLGSSVQAAPPLFVQEDATTPVASGPESAAEPAAAADNHQGGHEDPFTVILLELALLILAAVVGRWGAGRLKQPSVLGELLIGVALGNIGYWLGRPVAILVMHLESARDIFREVWALDVSVAEAASHVFSSAELAPGGVGAQMLRALTGVGAGEYVLIVLAIWLFSNLGVILLLFMVGLESSVEEMVKVGPRASLVAVVGIAAPFVFGLGASIWLLPEASTPVHLFLGATLSATSVGITARVFKDLGKLQTSEAKLILGAAVIDDILGLIILAVVVGIVATGRVNLSEVARILVLSALFLGGMVLLGKRLMHYPVAWFSRADRKHLKLLFPLTLAFLAAWAASMIGLAAIVGAFAAGLILSEEHFMEYTLTRTTTTELIAPLEALFAPIFFVLMGMQVNLNSFLEPGTLRLALAFVAAAVVGKLVAGFPAGKGLDRLSVGIGMVPRGEVGLIFASIGKGLGVVTDAVFSAVVIMVIVTTLITPVGLRWSLFRSSGPD